MIAVALKGLAGRKLRALLTAFAVVIGVSMVSGTFILTDTMQKTFDGLFAASYEDTDAVIAGKQIVESSMSGSTTIPESLLTKVQALPEVESAGGTVSPAEGNAADIIGSDGKAVANESLGVSVDAANPQFSPLKLKTGEWPSGPRAGRDRRRHRREGALRGGRLDRRLHVGRDHLLHASPAPCPTARSTRSASAASSPGTSRPPRRCSTARACTTRSRSPPRTAPRRPSSSSAVRPLLPDTLEVKDSAKQAEEASAEIDEGMAYIRYFLLGFGAIALFVGAFVIFNTLSITVAQRTREFATLRTLGASRKQVLRSVRLEGLVIGLVASTIGLFLGLRDREGHARAVQRDGRRPAGGLGGLRAAHRDRLAAAGHRDHAARDDHPGAPGDARAADRRGPRGLDAAGVALRRALAEGGARRDALVARRDLGRRVRGGISGAAVGLLLGLGVIGLFLGIALLAPRMVKPLARLVGWPARRAGGVAGELAGSNALRNPGRTASTAAALMIGITLVTVVAVLGAGMSKATEYAVTDQVRASYVVDGQDGLPFDAEDGDELAQVAGVKAASHVRSDKALVKGEEIDVTGIDAATIDRFYRFEWTAGSAGRARQRTARS